ncbi:MAG: alpha/beta hydrolase fold domain-containing protein [Actinomycetota bacterium]|nr:alpha/beta hydrolase fold domain-containing protein [Actinomycetota bacterium]
MSEVREQIRDAIAQAHYAGPLSIEVLRQFEKAHLTSFPEVLGAEVVRDAVAGVPVEWTRPDGVSSEAGVVLYLHGGGYTQGSPESSRRIVTTLATAARTLAVLSTQVGYEVGW